MNKNKIIYLISTGLLTLLMFFSIGMYLFNHAMVVEMFEGFGYPGYLVYPLAGAKVLGLFAIWNPNFKSIKEWAYAGFFFDFVLAFFAHYMISDGGQGAAVMGLVLIIVSYIFSKRK